MGREPERRIAVDKHEEHCRTAQLDQLQIDVAAIDRIADDRYHLRHVALILPSRTQHSGGLSIGFCITRCQTIAVASKQLND